MKRYLPLLFLFFTGFVSGNAQLLYKVVGKNTNSPSYIFGSHHLSPISIIEEAGVMEILPTTDQVVGEIDLTGDPTALALALQPYMMAPADSTLSVLLVGEDFDTLDAQFQKWAPMPGMTLGMLDPLKPMAVTTMMAAAMSQQVMPGFDPTQQLDSFIMQSGAKDGKKIIALETPQYQGEVLFNMTPLSVQAEALVDMLKNPDDALEEARKLTEAYKTKNLDAMLELSKADEKHPEFMEYILYRRNADWLQKLPGIIEEAPSFIVVGALHLAGPEGIIEGLKSEGFTVTPLY